MIYRVFLSLCIGFLAACASSTNTTLSTGEKSAESIDDVFEERHKTSPSGDSISSNATEGVGQVGIDQQSFQEYADYQAWLNAREPGSVEYDQFQLWREYLEFLRVTEQ